MKQDIKVPAVGESITEATIGSWTKKSGEFVKRNDVLMLLETDKASVEVVAENDGVLTILPGMDAGATVQIGATVATLDTDAKPAAGAAAPAAEAPKAAAPTPAAPASAPTAATGAGNQHLSPAVQRIVTENQIDPSQVAGTGKDGRLTKGDVLAATPGTAGKAAPAAAPAAATPAPAKAAAPTAVPMATGPSKPVSYTHLTLPTKA